MFFYYKKKLGIIQIYFFEKFSYKKNHNKKFVSSEKFSFHLRKIITQEKHFSSIKTRSQKNSLMISQYFSDEKFLKQFFTKEIPQQFLLR